MSTKRTSPESSTDEQTNEGSDSADQQDGHANKRVKLTSFSDTTLQDLPIEMIECILLKAVTMEVKGMKLAKSVWKAKADLVISRLRTVCSQWSSILTTNFFRNQLNRTLDGTAQKTLCFEILHQSPLQCYVSSIATMKDEIFMLCQPHGQDHFINVYDRNNMSVVRDVIPLPELQPRIMAACSVSNCVYVLSRVHNNFSIWRIARDDEHRYSVSPMNSNMYLPEPIMCVTANGSLAFSRQLYKSYAPVITCDANGSMQHEMRLSPNIPRLRNIIPKSNGNIVLVSGCPANLLEIDMDGVIIRQYQSSLQVYKSISQADIYGRMLITDWNNRMELLDSEFNLMDFTDPLLGGGQAIVPLQFYYNSERNEIVAIILSGQNFQDLVLAIFHLTEL